MYNNRWKWIHNLELACIILIYWIVAAAVLWLGHAISARTFLVCFVIFGVCLDASAIARLILTYKR